MKKVLMKLDTLNKLASAINTKLAPRKYRIKELPKAVDDVFSKELEAVRKEYREFLYGPKSVFSDPYSMINYIDDLMFYGRDDLQEVASPITGGVGEYAFIHCRNLRKVSFPNCKKIDDYAFAHCTSLEEISGFPSGGSHGWGVFYDCKNLRSVSLDWDRIGIETFESCEKLESGNFPYATTLSLYAFASCYNLKYVSMPNVISMVARVFEHCSSLEEISLPALQYTSGYETGARPAGGNFHNCINLKSAYLPNCVKLMGGDFENCRKLEDVYIPKLTYIPNILFASCQALKNITASSFPLVSEIKNFAFEECISLEYAEFANGFCNVNRSNPDLGRQFYNCISLKRIKLFGSYTQSNEIIGVPSLAFYNCYNLESIDYSYARQICRLAFYNCSKLSYVSFPECSMIGPNAFENCITLSSVYIDNVDTIYPYAFLNCRSLSQAIFSQCSLIGPGAFKNCVNLSEAELNAVIGMSYLSGSVNTDQGVFYGCSNLKTVQLLNLESPAIGDEYAYSYSDGHSQRNGMFKNCIQLENVLLSSSYSAVVPQMFYNCQALSFISIPECVVIGAWAFMNCSSLESIDFPKCSRINSQAFMNCTALSYINIPSCTYLSDSVFQNCSSLVSIELFSAAPNLNGPSNQTQTSCIIASNCFKDCMNLRTVSIAELSYIRLDIYRHAFRNCLSLESFITNAGGTLIGDFIFDHCSSLSIISCPHMMINGHYVFANCTGVEEIHIGTVMHAFQYSQPWPYNYRYTFANCINLKRLYIMGLFVPYRDYNSIFYNCGFLEEGDLYVPSSLYNAYLYSTGNWLSVMDESRIHPI